MKWCLDVIYDLSMMHSVISVNGIQLSTPDQDQVLVGIGFSVVSAVKCLDCQDICNDHPCFMTAGLTSCTGLCLMFRDN